MEKHKENLFLEKFRLLNSQELSEEINWSSSCSSDFEDTSLNHRFSNQAQRTRVSKRKRKKKVLKNVSNLSITILDTSRETEKVISKEKSPILGRVVRGGSNSASPILKSCQTFCKGNTISSPILTSRTSLLKSPILIPKTASPKSAVKVRKKLFNIEKNKIDRETQNTIKQEVLPDISIKKEREEIDRNPTLNTNNSNAKQELVKRVKSFFDSNFSSQNTSGTSQNSISEIITPNSSTKTSEEIEIFTCKTPVISNISNNVESKQDVSNSSENSVYNFNKPTKKIRYKKDGHAYRLNKLLVKQQAGLSLWQHEKFLAANSNFVIPKKEFTAFRIQKVDFKYGCHLIECVDVSYEKFLILINSSYVLENIVCESILKLYEPYTIIQFSTDCKLIISVVKFECETIQS